MVSEGSKLVGDANIFSLSRSGWAGSQRFGGAIWSGDIESTFESLQLQVRAGLNIALSGIAWWTTDIGGFGGGNTDDPYFRELIVRWFQYGMFCPLFRLHGVRNCADTQGFQTCPNEPWSFGNTAYTIIVSVINFRETLRGYVTEMMFNASTTGAPPIRPLFFDFPNDALAATIDDEYMFGYSLLIAPILKYQARNRTVYLPAGSVWTDWWSKKLLAGGTTLLADAPLEHIPIYIRGQTFPPKYLEEHD